MKDFRGFLAEAFRGWRNRLSGRVVPAGVRLPLRVRRYEWLYDVRTGYYHEGVRGRGETGSVEVEVGRLWYALCMLLRPTAVLETGTARGYSTCCIAAALRDLDSDGRVITIDPVTLDHLWRGTRLARFIEFRASRSQDQFESLREKTFDLLVLDSDHSYNTIIAELVGFEPLLKKGGHIFMHDTLHFDGVGAAVRQLMADPRFEVLTLDSPRTQGKKFRPPGITVVRKRAHGAALAFDPRYDGLAKGDPREAAVLRSARDPARPAR